MGNSSLVLISHRGLEGQAIVAVGDVQGFGGFASLSVE
jgi:hypothetical protein